MLAAAHQEVPEQLHRLAQKDPRFRCRHDDTHLSCCNMSSCVQHLVIPLSAEVDWGLSVYRGGRKGRVGGGGGSGGGGRGGKRGVGGVGLGFGNALPAPATSQQAAERGVTTLSC